MPTRYWMPAIAVVGIVLLGALSWWLVERQNERESAYQSSYKQYEDTKRDLPLGVATDGKRSVPDPKSYREEWRSERDLEAQREMADWAFFMLIAASAGVLITAVGVVYVAHTLNATREAVTAAVETVVALQRSERAYVTISHQPPGLDLISVSGHAKFAVEIKNSGRTPATVTGVHIELGWFGRRSPPPLNPVYTPNEQASNSGGFLAAGENFFAYRVRPIPNKGEGDNLWLFGYVDYSDVFGEDHRGGYARVYTGVVTGPESQNNLMLVDRPNWNYDETRRKGGHSDNTST